MDPRPAAARTFFLTALRDQLVFGMAGAVAEIESGLFQRVVEFFGRDSLVLQRDQAPENREAALHVQAHAHLPHAKLRIEPGHQVLEGEEFVVAARTEKALGTSIVVSMTTSYLSDVSDVSDVTWQTSYKRRL